MISKSRMTVLALVGAIAISPVAALAAENGVTGCLHMQKETSQALDAHQTSPNFSDARAMERAGSEFCQAGFYDQGLARFAKALDLLGVKAADLGHNPS